VVFLQSRARLDSLSQCVRVASSLSSHRTGIPEILNDRLVAMFSGDK